MRLLLVCLLSAAVAACAVTPPASNYRPVRQDIDFPSIGAVTQVEPGKDMIRHGHVTITRGIRLFDPVQIGKYRLEAGFYPRTGEDQSYSYQTYATGRPQGDIGVLHPVPKSAGRWTRAPDSIRSAKDGSEICLLFAGDATKACRSGVKWRQIRYYHLTETDLQQKLIFEGVEDDRIRIRYWENSGHFARPEFSQELEFPTQLPRVIDFKGARLRIEQADATGIRFVVLENFPPYWSPPRIEPQL